MSTSPQSSVQGTAEPVDRPSRRSFTAAYKWQIVAEYDAAPDGWQGFDLASGGAVFLASDRVASGDQRRHARRRGAGPQRGGPCPVGGGRGRAGQVTAGEHPADRRVGPNPRRAGGDGKSA